MSKAKQVTVYIDGFNLYHAINALGANHLKWLNYVKLAESFLRADECLRAVYMFSSPTKWSPEKLKRHETYLAALRAVGVVVAETEFKKAKKYCKKEDRYCKFWEEKQADVAIAVQMIGDAHAGKTNRIILLTADTDQIPAVKYLQAQFPEIELSLAIPPGRKNEARDLGMLFKAPVEIDSGRLEANLLPETVVVANGRPIQMPVEYSKPSARHT